jgi:D-glycero-alpha-D-manno-heptose-7-phosphate kinase
MEFSHDEKVIVNPLRLKRWIRNELESSLVLYYTGVSRESAAIISTQIHNAEQHNAQSLENMHILKRNAVEMKEALLMGDFGRFAACLASGWEAKKRVAAAISNPFIDELYEFALGHGALAAKISGAGGGGFMMLYTDPRSKMGLQRALRERGGVLLPASFTEIGTQAWTIYKT